MLLAVTIKREQLSVPVLCESAIITIKEMTVAAIWTLLMSTRLIVESNQVATRYNQSQYTLHY